MQKKFFVFLVALVWSIALVGASVTLDSLEISVQGGGYPRQGSTIVITMYYRVADIPEGESMYVYGIAIGVIDQAQIKWYQNADGTGTVATQNITVSQIANTIYYDPDEEGYTTSHTATFTLPAPPSNKKSFTVSGKVYAATSDDEFTYIYSGPKTSNYLVINNPPVASNVIIVDPTLARVGQTITGDYDYSDPDSDPEGTSTFRWLSCSTENGTYTAISGATSLSYTVQSSDANKYLKFEVTPVASAGQSPGTAVLSDATPKVTGAPIVEIDPSTLNIYEASANDGSLGDTYVKITCTNTSFKSSITISDITISKELDGLSKGSLSWISANDIRLYFSGAAVNHEYAAKIDTIRITVNKNQLEGVENNLTTQNSFNINFTNNPPTNLALDSVGNNYVTITWDNPAGLLTSGSGLDYYNIYRNEQFLCPVYLDKGKGTYSYPDTDVTNGTQYRYKVQAVYKKGGTNETTPDAQKATPLAITAFSFSSPSATGTIDHTNKTIKVAVPNGTNRTNLIATFTAPGAIVTVGTTTQTSGSTVNNFTNPVTYILTTSGDASTCSYVVTVNEKLPAPTTLDGNNTTSSIQAKWNAVSGAESYLLDVSTNSSFSGFLAGYENKSVTSTSWTVNGLSANTTYYYRVKAVASDQYFNSEYSTTKEVTTDNVSPGEGSTEINSSDETTINVGEFIYGQETVTPTVKVDPTEFSPSENDIITVSMSYGTTPEGLQYTLAFENPTIGNGTFILSYSGLSYDPTDVGYRLNGGDLHSVGGGGINTTDKTVTFTMSGLGKGSKATYELQIVLNDESGQTLPVVLTSFTATPMVDGKVRVDWATQSETNLSGFRVLRNTVAEISTAIAVSPLIEAMNTSATVVYSFMDSEVPGNGIYYYWLQIEDLDGGISYSAVYTVQVTTGGVTNPIIPKITALLNPFPNPFNPDVTIPFDLAVEGKVTLKIYNLKGQLIKNLLNENCKANSYRIVWDGKDNEGHNVSTGTYIIRMNAPNYQASHKISLIK
ncbi:MAG: FlgD immunoglobulin-like domain containing protein [Candidatus Cloacimonas acidaminovorans]|nr:FlgD immunoglobulin-like domain containing protein [Candidatus Cloacimonas acidaminovorans]MDD5407434.1 FlgD immunoglobulin-like domain containing protein [Candidatus Cloacimonas acidaminovorans]